MLPWVSAFQGSLSETFPGPFDSGSSHTLCRPEDCSSDPPAPQSVDRSPTSSIRSVVPKHEARTEHPHRLFAPARSLAFGHCAPRAMCSLLIVSCITADQTDDLWGTFLPCRSRRDSLAVPDIRAAPLTRPFRKSLSRCPESRISQKVRPVAGYLFRQRQSAMYFVRSAPAS
jgi:hypothetical protein